MCNNNATILKKKKKTCILEIRHESPLIIIDYFNVRSKFDFLSPFASFINKFTVGRMGQMIKIQSNVDIQ